LRKEFSYEKSIWLVGFRQENAFAGRFCFCRGLPAFRFQRKGGINSYMVDLDGESF